MHIKKKKEKKIEKKKEEKIQETKIQFLPIHFVVRVVISDSSGRPWRESSPRVDRSKTCKVTETGPLFPGHFVEIALDVHTSTERIDNVGPGRTTNRFDSRYRSNSP